MIAEHSAVVSIPLSSVCCCEKPARLCWSAITHRRLAPTTPLCWSAITPWRLLPTLLELLERHGALPGDFYQHCWSPSDSHQPPLSAGAPPLPGDSHQPPVPSINTSSLSTPGPSGQSSISPQTLSGKGSATTTEKKLTFYHTFTYENDTYDLVHTCPERRGSMHIHGHTNVFPWKHPQVKSIVWEKTTLDA